MASEKFGRSRARTHPGLWMLHGDAHGYGRGLNRDALQGFNDSGVPDELVEARGEFDSVADGFQWKEWQTEDLMQKEVRINRQPGTDLRVDQGEYLQTSGRKKIRDAAAPGGESGQPRAVLGATGWRSKQLVSVRSVDTSLTRSMTSSSTVQTINEEDQMGDQGRRDSVAC